MTKSLRIVTGGGLNSVNTYYASGLSGYVGNATEAPAQIACRPGGTFTSLWMYVSANTLTSAHTYKLRKNGVDANNQLSIGAGTTGTFEYTASSDTFADGDLISFLSVVPGTAARTITFGPPSILFEPTGSSNVYSHVGSTGAVSFATASVTRYLQIGGFSGTPITTEVTAQTLFKSSCTLKNLSLYVSTNARTATTFRTRKNVGNGNQSISVGSSATGRFEDTSNTDSIVANDLVNLSFTTGTGTSTIVFNYTANTIESTTNVNYLPWGYTNGVAIAYPDNRHFNPGLTTLNTTEALSQTKLRMPKGAKLKNSTVTISANSTAYATYLYARFGGSYQYPEVNITASTTGNFSDTTNSSTIEETTLFNLIYYAAGALGGSVTMMCGMIELIPDVQITNTKTHKYNVTAASQNYPVTITEPTINPPTESLTRSQTRRFTIADTPTISVNQTITRVYGATRPITDTPTISVNQTISRIQTILKEITETDITVNDSTQGSLVYILSIIESRIKWYYSLFTRKIPEGEE